MARKIALFDRVLGREDVYALIYGEISSSLYFALGVIALYSLGLTPVVLLIAGLLFGLAARAYAAGSEVLEEGGGSSAIARRAFGDLVGHLVGWAVLLDLAVVVALSLLFVPHYAAASVGRLGVFHGHTDVMVAAVILAAIAALFIFRRPQLTTAPALVAFVDMAVQGVLAVLGVALVYNAQALRASVHLGTVPNWNAIAYSLPIAMLAFTGIETVASMLNETRRPSRLMDAGMVGAVAATIVIYALIAASALSALPIHPAPGTPSGAASSVSTTWLNAPLAGVAQAIGDTVDPNWGVVLRFVVALSAVLVLIFGAVASFATATRVISSLGTRHGLPRGLAAPDRRSVIPPLGIAGFAVVVGLLLLLATSAKSEVTGLASLYSFGILSAFAATFLGVLWMRSTGAIAPEKQREVPLIARRGVRVNAVVGFALSWVFLVLALGTHPAVWRVIPIWLAIGLLLFVVARRAAGMPIVARGRTPAPAPEVVEEPYGTIIVPVKQAGPIEDEMLATACKLAQQESGSRVVAVHVVEVPLSDPLDIEIPGMDEAAAQLRARAAQFAADYRVPVALRSLRSRAISSTVTQIAEEEQAGLILLGAVPRFQQRAGRAEIFSDTIENLLRRAHCRVIVTAFPPGTASVDDAPETEPAAHAH